MRATFSFLISYSGQHLASAALLSLRVAELEHADPAPTSMDEITAYATGAVILSVAALEAYVNDLFVNRAHYFPRGIPNDDLEALNQKNIVDKFKFALLLRSGTQTAKGGDLYRDIKLVIALRNALTHFRAEWDHEATSHAELSQKLKGKFVPSAIEKHGLLFPRRWVTHGCTRWAVNSCRDFLRAFEKRAGLEDRLVNFSDRLDPG